MKCEILHIQKQLIVMKMAVFFLFCQPKQDQCRGPISWIFLDQVASGHLEPNLSPQPKGPDAINCWVYIFFSYEL